MSEDSAEPKGARGKAHPDFFPAPPARSEVPARPREEKDRTCCQIGHHKKGKVRIASSTAERPPKREKPRGGGGKQKKGKERKKKKKKKGRGGRKKEEEMTAEGKTKRQRWGWRLGKKKGQIARIPQGGGKGGGGREFPGRGPWPKKEKKGGDAFRVLK